MVMNGVQPFISASVATKNYERGETLPLGSQPKPIETAQPGATIVNLGRAESVADVAKQYDVRHMSPLDMSKLSQRLYDTGAISFKDHSLLSFQPELGAGFVGDASLATAPKDFMQAWEQQLVNHQQRGEEAFAENDRRILNILGNIDALRQS